MPCIFVAVTRHMYIFLHTINYALRIPGRYEKGLLISPHKYVCHEYSWQIRDRFTYLSTQLSTPCLLMYVTRQIYLFLPTIKYAL